MFMLDMQSHCIKYVLVFHCRLTSTATTEELQVAVESVPCSCVNPTFTTIITIARTVVLHLKQDIVTDTCKCEGTTTLFCANWFWQHNFCCEQCLSLESNPDD